MAIDPSEKGESYRKLWDKGTNIKHNQPTIPKPLSATQMLADYAATFTKHVAGGRVMVPDSIHQYRRGMCNDCQHRNKETDRCGICSCKITPNLIEATVLGDKLRWAVASCPVDKWKPWDASMSQHDNPRHLLFHIWPRKVSAGTWQRNLDQLKQRWGLFTGKRVIAVATSVDSHPVEAVQDYMRGYDCEWIAVENDPKLREVKTFLPLFERVEGLPGYTFYAQGKGVTKPINPGISIHRWTSAMYETLLDYWPLVEERLQQFPVVGSFKKGIAGFTGSRSTWHYSGSFCWFRNADLWKRNWRAIEQVWFGIESYPSMLYTTAEAGTVFFSKNGKFNLYSLRAWEEIERELEAWRQAQARYRSATGSLMTTGNH